MKLILDFGNTRIKAAVFDEKKELDVKDFSSKDIDLLKQYIITLKDVHHIGVCWNCADNDFIDFLLDTKINFTILSDTTPLPIKNLYKTPKTLGKDRLSIAVAAHQLYPRENILIISMGSCITYDFINDNDEYIGGLISLGVQMRFNALHYYTNALPKIDFHGENDINNDISIFYNNIAQNTHDAVVGGVISGVINEINAQIDIYQRKYKNLKIILSGGDAKYFEKSIIFPIFAHSNLVLKGMNEILDWNF